ncbi:MAG TPA: uroporphyrinogen decarboxylase family protein [Sedimentisphaerales bacterium]|nr:uroporphyrinogen decarboxylase family protein [Sedimentisphaerales bacterium]
MATLRGKTVDRPAVNFYEVGGFQVDPSDPDELNVYNDPSWQPLLQLAEEQTDLIRMRSPIKSRSHEVISDQPDAGRCRDEFFKTEEYMEKGCRFISTTLKIGGRNMTALTRRSPEVDTVWTVEHLLKNPEDLKAYLELPDEIFAEDVDVTSLVEEDRELADRGIIMVDTEDPICAAASLFSMENFTVIALTEQKLFGRLLEKLSGHIQARTEKTAKAFPGHLWRIYGPEYATEPYLPPNLFKEYVVRYTGPMVEAIQKHGGFARIHCHGRIRAVLDYIVEMGAAAIDPIEPPPHGDVELEYVRREYGRELVLFGNLEVADIENSEPGEFEKLVEKCLRDGTCGEGKGFVLMPSSAPTGREITPRMMANYETMVRLATG